MKKTDIMSHLNYMYAVEKSYLLTDEVFFCFWHILCFVYYVLNKKLGK